jgi:hypothetical protein
VDGLVLNGDSRAILRTTRNLVERPMTELTKPSISLSPSLISIGGSAGDSLDRFVEFVSVNGAAVIGGSKGVLVEPARN